MKKTALIIFILFSFFGVFAQETTEFGTETYETDYKFGFRIAPTYSGIVQYCVVYAPGGKIEDVRPISMDAFLKEAGGRFMSDANPNAEGLFKKNGIKDSLATLNNLWRLRYKYYPLRHCPQDSVGWSASPENYIPSKNQTLILNGYGVDNINGIFFGNNAFRLLRDMENENWITTYKEAKDEPEEDEEDE